MLGNVDEFPYAKEWNWTLHHIQNQLKLDQKPKQELKQLE